MDGGLTPKPRTLGRLTAIAAWVRANRVGAVITVAAVLYPVLSPQLPGGLPVPDLNGYIVILYYAALALGLNIVVGFAGLLDLGYVAFFAIGAYVTAFLASPHFDIHLAWLVVVWVAVAVAALAGAVLGAPTLRLRGDYLAIVTLGFGEIIPLVFRNLGDVTVAIGGITILGPHADLTGGNLGINPIDPLRLPNPFGGVIEFSNTNLTASVYLILALLGLAYVVSVRLRESWVGRAWLAVREDETAAASSGVNTTRSKLLAFAIGASFSGFVGAFVGAYQTAIFPESFKFSISITILVMVILGGIGNVRGVILGAVAVQYVNLTLLAWLGKGVNSAVREFGRQVDVQFLEDFALHNFNFLIFGLVLVGMMLVRPEGLLPARPPRAVRQSHGLEPSAHPATPDTAADRIADQRPALADPAAPLLEVRGISKVFDGLVAVDKVDVKVERGSIVSLIGPNGAGKTTLFNMVTGVIRPNAGTIMLAGEDITGRRPHVVAGQGIARTFQNIRLFGSMTVVENVLVGLNHRFRSPWWDAILRRRRSRDEERTAVARAFALLELVGLPGRADDVARNLSYGDQRRLEIARALATDPMILMLDEPTAGMNPGETRVMTELIRRLRDELKLTIVLIEHDMRVVMGISDHVTVLDYGHVIAEGVPSEISSNPQVVEAYLGGQPLDAGPRASVRQERPVILELDGVHTSYGSIEALRGISLIVRDEEVVALIGANGAGKTTALKTIGGLLRCRRGEIRYAGQSVTHVSAHERVARGISQCLEGRRVFGRMTVRENLELGAYQVRDPGQLRRDFNEVMDLFPRLRERLDQLAGTLSGGEQQMLAIGRALMARPRLLLLDEPSMGLAPKLVEQIFAVVRQINQRGTAILLVEQNAAAALSIADRGYILQSGEVVLEGTASSLTDNPNVRAAYLGI